MKPHNLKFFFRNNKKLLTIIAIAVPLIAGAIFIAPPIINTVQRNMAVNRFHNMSREAMLEDFDYLMEALEGSWPFFNLSISANDVDVRDLADNMRVLIMDPNTDINNPHDFLDLLHIHFIIPIRQLGHLNAIIHYQEYFFALSSFIENIERGARQNLDAVADYYTRELELYTRPEVAMFYQTLREAGGSAVAQDITWPPRALFDTPVLETDILEEGRIAYLNINMMIHPIRDPRYRGTNMGQYEVIMHNFYKEIGDFDHLIIDMRGNPGGQTTHFDIFVAGPLLSESITFPGYVFYKGGEYDRTARSNFDPRAFDIDFGMDFDGERTAFDLAQPLPYLDRHIDFAYAFASEYTILPGRYHSDQFATIGTEVAFDGKIWMLIDERTASAAEGASAIFKYTNTATLVGEATWGIVGTMYDATSTMISLPNTGIVLRFDIGYFTCPDGRALQGHGIAPHYFNRDGLDALGTVLEMIGESE